MVWLASKFESNFFLVTLVIIFVLFFKFCSKPMEEDSTKTEEEFNTGPLSVLMMSVKNNTQVSFNHVLVFYSLIFLF